MSTIKYPRDVIRALAYLNDLTEHESNISKNKKRFVNISLKNADLSSVRPLFIFIKKKYKANIITVFNTIDETKEGLFFIDHDKIVKSTLKEMGYRCREIVDEEICFAQILSHDKPLIIENIEYLISRGFLAEDSKEDAEIRNQWEFAYRMLAKPGNGGFTEEELKKCYGIGDSEVIKESLGIMDAKKLWDYYVTKS